MVGRDRLVDEFLARTQSSIRTRLVGHSVADAFRRQPPRQLNRQGDHINRSVDGFNMILVAVARGNASGRQSSSE